MAPMAEYETLLVSLADGVAIITLNRPQALNAFTRQMNTELRAALRELGRSADCRAIVLTGAGRAFCAGQDLDARRRTFEAGEVPHLGESLRQNYNPLILQMRALEQPILAAVNGAAAGAGMSLALACDLRMAAASARFIQSFVRVGLAQDSGSSYTLPRLVGLGRAQDLALLGEPLGAEDARRARLVNWVVPDEQLSQRAAEVAGRLARGSRQANALIKRGVYRALTFDLERTLEYEADLQEIAGRGPDFLEGIRAFTEKRPPRFA
jgi:2-(1,2-epoxy-1,2-dihydrophenyl)acetyl-CoA isomerase